MPDTEKRRPVSPGQISIEAAVQGEKRNHLFQEEALARGKGSHKEDSIVRILGPSLPSKFKPSDLGHQSHAFNIHNMTSFH